MAIYRQSLSAYPEESHASIAYYNYPLSEFYAQHQIEVVRSHRQMILLLMANTVCDTGILISFFFFFPSWSVSDNFFPRCKKYQRRQVLITIERINVMSFNFSSKTYNTNLNIKARHTGKSYMYNGTRYSMYRTRKNRR